MSVLEISNRETIVEVMKTYQASKEVRRGCQRHSTRTDICRVYFTAVYEGCSINEEAIEEYEEKDEEDGQFLAHRVGNGDIDVFGNHGGLKGKANETTCESCKKSLKFTISSPISVTKIIGFLKHSQIFFQCGRLLANCPGSRVLQRECRYNRATEESIPTALSSYI